MIRLTIIIAIVLLMSALGVISLIHFDYKSAAIWLSSGIVVLFILSYSKSISEIFRNKLSINQIKAMTRKIFSDMVL